MAEKTRSASPELRKVQLTGGSSLTVTLPKAWVERVRLRPGDRVGLVEQPDGSLAVQAHARAEREAQRYVVDAQDGDTDYLFRKIIAAYLMGYDAIVLASKKGLPAPARAAIRTAVRRIIGLEIVEEDANSITVQDFLDPREFHLDKALRRMGLLTRAMQEEALATLAEPDPEVLRSIEDRDDEVDRLYWLVSKQYHAMLRDTLYAAKMDLTTSKALNFLLLARLVERTADHADRIARESLLVPRTRTTEPILARVEKEGRRSADLFRDALETFHRGDSRKANEVIETAEDLKRAQERLLKDAAALGGETVAHLVAVVESIGRTAAYAADIGEVAINHTVASKEA